MRPPLKRIKKAVASPFGETTADSVCQNKLAFCDSVVRTNLSAAAAADASVGIDVIDVALRDSVNGANRHASAACDAVIANYVCHNN